jgi:hypothetical protein
MAAVDTTDTPDITDIVAATGITVESGTRGVVTTLSITDQRVMRAVGTHLQVERADSIPVMWAHPADSMAVMWAADFTPVTAVAASTVVAAASVVAAADSTAVVVAADSTAAVAVVTAAVVDTGKDLN